MEVHNLPDGDAFSPQHWPQLLNDALQERADTRDWQAAGNVSPATVLDAYRNNTRQGRIRALQVTFPVVEQLLGNAAFAAYAGDYVTRYPAGAADLDTFGDQFADFLRDCQSLQELPYVAEMAAFEWCVQAARFAPLEVALSGEVLMQSDEQQLETLRVSTPRSLQQLKCEHNIHDLWLWHRQPEGDFQLQHGAFNLVISMQRSATQGWHIAALAATAEEAGLLNNIDHVLLTDVVESFAARGLAVSETLQSWLIRQWLVAHD